MSEEAESKSNAGRWVIAVIGVLVLYVLSIGPVSALSWKYHHEMPWLEKPIWGFYAPLRCVVRYAPSGGEHLFDQYFMLWCDACNISFPPDW